MLGEFKELIMDSSAQKNRNKSRLPKWQSEKMKNLIDERWSEVWEIVMARERSHQNSH